MLGVGICMLAGDRGQALVEVALLLPLLVFGLIGGVDMARAYAAQLGVQNAARAGAEAYLLGVATTDAAITTYVQNELSGVPGVTASAATVTVTHSTVSGVSYVTVRVRYIWRTLVAWPLVPNQATFDRSTQMRKLT
jgi:Flp pilus assembly protein TadG